MHTDYPGYLKILEHKRNSDDLKVDYEKHKYGVGDPEKSASSYFIGR